jgi:hypothetical protein
VRPLADSKLRTLLVTPQIDALLDGHIEFGNFPARETEILIGKFVAGQLLTVSRQMTDQGPDVEQVVGQNEVWALCPRRPKPGWRILGRWFDRGVFVALRAWDKHRLFNKYPRASQAVIQDWDELLSGIQPHSALELGDYLDGVFRDVDEQERRS